MSKPNLNIQALRAVAALLVIVAHASHETEAIAAATGAAAIVPDFLNWAASVDIFFIISGYIMIYSSVSLFARPGGWYIFLLRRLTRIVPLYWLLTSVMLLGALVAPSLLNVPIGDWQYLLSSYLFIPALRAGEEIRPVLSLGWTLNLEMLFYAIFMVIVVLPYRYGVAALSAIIVALAVFGHVFQPHQVQLAFWTQAYLLDFLFGSLLAAAYLAGARLPLALAILLAVVGIAGIFTGGPFDRLPDYLRWSLPALLLVSAAAFSADYTPRVLHILVVLGNASYSLYLLHPFVLRPLRVIWIHTIGGRLPLITFIVVALTLSSIGALLLYRWVEKPMLRFFHRRLLSGDGKAAHSKKPAEAAVPK